MKKIFNLISLAFFSIVLGNVAASFAGVSPAVTIPSFAALALFSGPVASGVLLSSVDVSAISRYANQYMQSLIATLVNGLDIANDITVMPGVKTSMKMPKLFVADGFRPYSGSTEFQTGDLQYTDRELKVDVGKRELLIDPEDYRQTYMATQLSIGSPATKPKQELIPFAQFLWDQVIKKVSAEINDRTAYFGFDKADAVLWDIGTIYTPGDYVYFTQVGVVQYFLCVTITVAGESPDTDPAKWQNATAEAVAIGIKKIIDDEVTATTITPVATGAITDGPTAIAAFKEIFRTFPAAYRSQGVIMHASYTDMDFYVDGVEDKITKYTMYDVSDIANQGLIPLLGSNGKGWIKPATWLGAERRIIGEPRQMNQPKGANLVFGTDLLSDANQITTKDNLWTLEVGIKMVLGWQIANTDAIVINDQ